MKQACIIAALMAVLGVLSIRQFGQPISLPAGVPATKIAFIDSDVFADEKRGITRYVAAMKSLEREFKGKSTEDKATFQKRYEETINPIASDISKALDQFAVQRNITLTLNISKLQPAILTIDPATDVTESFIADYNSKHPATGP